MAYSSFASLNELVLTLKTNDKNRIDTSSAQDIKHFIWERYDPHDDLIYPITKTWDELLENTIRYDLYVDLDKEDVLNILFGLINRTRISEGLWLSMYTRGVIIRLLVQLESIGTG